MSKTGPAPLHLAVLKFLKAEGLKDSAKTFAKEAKLEKASTDDALDLYKLIPEQKKVESSSDSDSDSSSSSSSSSSDSDSDSDSEEEKPAAAPVKTPAKTPVKKEESSDSSSSDSSSSDSDSSDSEDEKPAAKAGVKRPASSSSSSSSSDSSSSDSDSSDSESEEEKPTAKKVKTDSGAAAPVKTPAKVAPAAAPVTPAASGSFKAYVRGLPFRASEDEVREFFKSCGDDFEIDMIIGDDGRPSGTCNIKFGSRAELDAALALDGQYFPGTERWLKIVESTEKTPRVGQTFGGATGERPEGCDTVFVGNLSWDVDEDAMRAVFSAAGEISNVRFATGEDGSFRGFGHVAFYNGEDTIKAVALAGTPINGRPIRVDFAPPRQRDATKSPGGRGAGRGGRGDGGRGGRGGRGRGDAGGRGGFTPKGKGLSIGSAPSSNKKMTFDE